MMMVLRYLKCPLDKLVSHETVHNRINADENGKPKNNVTNAHTKEHNAFHKKYLDGY